MRLRDIAAALDLEVLTPALRHELDAEVTRAHTSDLLSDILAAAPAGALAVTLQAHMNTVAVAVHAHLAGVIFAGGRAPGDDVIERARDEGVPLLRTTASSFDVSGRLYELGLRGGGR